MPSGNRARDQEIDGPWWGVRANEPRIAGPTAIRGYNNNRNAMDLTTLLEGGEMKERGWRSNDPTEKRIAMFMRSIAETVRLHPRGITERDLLEEYLRKERMYVQEALERAKRSSMVICRDERLHMPSSVWSMKQPQP